MRALLARVNGELAALVAAEQARRDAARRGRGGRPGGTWDCIRQLESGNNYSSPGGGAYQFLDSTWRSVHGLARAETASRAEQDYRAWLVYRRDGGSWREWSTARGCGLT